MNGDKVLTKVMPNLGKLGFGFRVSGSLGSAACLVRIGQSVNWLIGQFVNWSIGSLIIDN